MLCPSPSLAVPKNSSVDVVPSIDRPQDEDPRFAQIMRVKNPKQRLRKFTDACKTRTVCPSSGTPQPQYRLEGMKITAEFKQRGRRITFPRAASASRSSPPSVRDLKNVSDEDCRILGWIPSTRTPHGSS